MGMLQNLGGSLKRRLGLTGPSEEELKGIANANSLKQQRMLEQEKQLSLEEASFLETEGQGVKRQAKLTFGDTERQRNLTKEQRSLRSSGRFSTDRLVL